MFVAKRINPDKTLSQSSDRALRMKSYLYFFCRTSLPYKRCICVYFHRFIYTLLYSLFTWPVFFADMFLHVFHFEPQHRNHTTSFFPLLTQRHILSWKWQFELFENDNWYLKTIFASIVWQTVCKHIYVKFIHWELCSITPVPFVYSVQHMQPYFTQYQ